MLRSFLMGTAMLGLLVTPLAADEVQVQVGPGGVKLGGGARAAATQSFRASKLIGMEVKNAAGEGLGSINDLVIDDRGNVRYAAVSFGGVLGVGSKLFAVPYRSFTFKTDVDIDSRYAELNVDRKLLEKAPGFPSDRWPDFGDEKFLKEVDGFYLDIGPVKVRTERD